MMAHDSDATPPRELAEETVALVREALEALLRAPSSDNGLRGALNKLATEAREKKLPPEQLLVMLKDTWYRLSTTQGTHDPDEQVRLLQRVVTMCIKEYYSS